MKKLATRAPCLALLDLAKKTVELIIHIDTSLATAGGVILENISGG